MELLGLFHARKLRAHELALRAGWDGVHAALGITQPFYDRFTPAISARDFALRPGPARARARLRRGAAREAGGHSAPPELPDAARPALARLVRAGGAAGGAFGAIVGAGCRCCR